jgi:hypothetical protein
MQANGEAKAGQEQFKAEEYNAGILRQNAEAVRLASRYDLYDMAKAKRRFLSNQQSLYAKSGVRSGEGSPLTVMIDSATEFAMASLIKKYNDQTQAAQLQNEAYHRLEIGSQGIQKANAQSQSTLLSTAGKTVSAYSDYRAAKTPTNTTVNYRIVQ